MSYSFSNFVNRKEAEALKEMIFNRVRERTKEIEDNVQLELMDSAREAFTDKSNPFYSIIQKEANKTVEKTPAQNIVKEQIVEQVAQNDSKIAAQQNDIGFEQKNININTHINNQAKIINNISAEIAIHNTMDEASQSLRSRKSFMGALEFLNSQAAVSLLKTNIEKFEVVV